MYGCYPSLVDYETWQLRVDVMFNVSVAVNGWIELRIAQLGLRQQQRIALDVNSTTVHIVTTVTQVQIHRSTQSSGQCSGQYSTNTLHYTVQRTVQYTVHIVTTVTQVQIHRSTQSSAQCSRQYSTNALHYTVQRTVQYTVHIVTTVTQVQIHRSTQSSAHCSGQYSTNAVQLLCTTQCSTVHSEVQNIV